MLTGHDFSEPLPESKPTQPFGYLYAKWDSGVPEETAEEMGYYDPEAQVWVSPGGFTMGIYTKTKTGGSCGDCVTDDACA
jgi:hypothetical protein